MEVAEYEPDDSYEARCTDCACCRLGKISPELLIYEGSHRQHSVGGSLRESPQDSSRLM